MVATSLSRISASVGRICGILPLKLENQPYLGAHLSNNPPPLKYALPDETICVRFSPRAVIVGNQAKFFGTREYALRKLYESDEADDVLTRNAAYLARSYEQPYEGGFRPATLSSSLAAQSIAAR